MCLEVAGVSTLPCPPKLKTQAFYFVVTLYVRETFIWESKQPKQGGKVVFAVTELKYFKVH